MNLVDALAQDGLHPRSTLPGRYYLTCPKCSYLRKGGHRRLKCLGLTIDPDGRGFKHGCNHCGFTGGWRAGGGGRLRDLYTPGGRGSGQGFGTKGDQGIRASGYFNRNGRSLRDLYR